MNTASNIKTSPAALAFFLSPLAWVQPCPETAGQDETSGIIADNGMTADAQSTATLESGGSKAALF